MPLGTGFRIVIGAAVTFVAVRAVLVSVRALLVSVPAASAVPATVAVPVARLVLPLVRRARRRRLLDGVRLLRVRAEFFDGSAAPRARESAVEVPTARVAVVHDAGRLSSAHVTFLGDAVKV
jgi:hypothetical protein